MCVCNFVKGAMTDIRSALRLRNFCPFSMRLASSSMSSHLFRRSCGWFHSSGPVYDFATAKKSGNSRYNMLKL